MRSRDGATPGEDREAPRDPHTPCSLPLFRWLLPESCVYDKLVILRKLFLLSSVSRSSKLRNLKWGRSRSPLVFRHVGGWSRGTEPSTFGVRR